MDAKLTRDHLIGLISATVFSRRDTTTICTLTVLEGFPVQGESHCAFRKDYVQAIGEKVAYENALKNLLKLEQYHQRKVALGSVNP